MERANGERGSEYAAGWTRCLPQGDVRTLRHAHTKAITHIHTHMLAE